MENVKESIKGIILPIDWDKDGAVNQTAIMTYDEDIYVLLDNDWIEQLKRHLRQVVTVDGEVTTHEKMKSIRVESLIIHK